jgi:AbrB family looped-hinge helix DNA binding protein
MMLSKSPKLLCKENGVTQSVNVKVSSRYQIALPRIARQRLNIQAGDRLLVDIQDGLLLPQPQDYVARMSGLHREVWEDLDTADYLRQERDAWDASAND